MIRVLKRLSRNLPAFLVAGLLSTAAHAWPDHPITLVVPYTPGTGIDLIARQLANHLPAQLGQPVVVSNVPGASGNIGSEKVAHAKPDGYTLLVQVSTLVMNGSLYKSLPYDPVADFTPVTLTSWGTLLLVANPQVQKATSVEEVAKAAKAAPGKLTYATPGVGTPHHLSMALFMQSAGIEMLHVPYKGTAGAVTDMLGGRIDYMFLPVHVALQHIQAGKLKAIAVTSKARTALAPEVPTMSEAGLPGYEVSMWNGLSAPAGTPASVVDRLAAAATKAVASDELQAKIKSNGGDPIVMGPKEFADYLQADIRRWSDAIKAAGIKPQ